MPDGKNYFSKFYVCFDGLKKGWRSGCRRIINLDGCFLKGLCSGELLSAVGRDANNQIFPIAWAVVCVENKQNWKWFLENLADDLHLESGLSVSLMSDQHKGLLEAVKEVLPDAEHRQCARHIYANFKKRFTGAQFETLFWKASKATTEPHFNAIMKEIQQLSNAAHEFLLEKNPKTWSRAFFKFGSMCDAVENGFSETFNSVITEARRKPIITMLEEIRMYVMDRMHRMQLKGSNWPDYEICPVLRQKINNLKVQQRLWEINGYACVHSLATISFVNGTIEQFVHPLYLGTFYKNTYSNPIKGMNGSEMWPQIEFIPPLPPIRRRMPGRPTIRRKKDASERSKKHTVSKVGKSVLCGICKAPGHNKITCKKNATTSKSTTFKRVNRKMATSSKCTTSGIQQPLGGEAGGTQESVCKKKPEPKRSERILKRKLGKTVEVPGGEGMSSGKPMELD
ncbi:hypothetical protein L1887_18295 [Cichorium endivia]|nr:hypothetical protein L1887_18295 [Cichorium endivia]